MRDGWESVSFILIFLRKMFNRYLDIEGFFSILLVGGY